MSIGNVNSAVIAAYQYANKAQKGSTAGKTSFAETVKQTAESGPSSRTDQYVEYLKERYGANVMVKNVGNDQRSVDNFGASIVGYNNVVIAPNILEKMANDPEKAAYYESKIQSALNDFPMHQAALSAMGHEIHSYAVGIDENGVVHKYVTGDLKPEVRAKMEAKVKAEQEEKRARREKYRELSEEASKKRRELAELQNQKRLMAEALQKSGFDMGADFYFVSQPQVSAAVAAYESTVGTYNNSIIGGI